MNPSLMTMITRTKITTTPIQITNTTTNHERKGYNRFNKENNDKDEI